MLAEAGKGSKQRPTNAVSYASNYETIFGRKYVQVVGQFNLCPWCGVVTINPCTTSYEAKECVNFRGSKNDSV